MSDIHKNLERLALLKGLSESEKEAFLRCVPLTLKSYSKGEIVALAGSPVQSAYIVVEGKLKGEMIDSVGNRLKIENIEAPTFVAAAFLFGQKNRFPVNLTAVSEASILIIPKELFIQLLSEFPAVMKNYLDIVSSKAQFLTQKITFLSLKTIRHKLAFFVLDLVKGGGTEFTVQQSKSQLSEMFGVARPSLARTIGELEKEGAFRWERKVISGIDTSLLQEILNS